MKVTDITKTIIIKEYSVACTVCGKEIRGKSESQTLYNLGVHVTQKHLQEERGIEETAQTGSTHSPLSIQSEKEVQDNGTSERTRGIPRLRPRRQLGNPNERFVRGHYGNP